MELCLWMNRMIVILIIVQLSTMLHWSMLPNRKMRTSASEWRRFFLLSLSVGGSSSGHIIIDVAFYIHYIELPRFSSVTWHSDHFNTTRYHQKSLSFCLIDYHESFNPLGEGLSRLMSHWCDFVFSSKSVILNFSKLYLNFSKFIVLLSTTQQNDDDKIGNARFD